MNFATRNFLIFFAVVLLVYHGLRTRSSKYRFLLAASWFFYMSWNPWFLWVILFTSLVDYLAGRLIESASTPRRRRAWLVMSLVTNLGFLAVFKYTNFFLGNALALARECGWTVSPWTVNLILPLGISFHTFQGISYTLDVYRGKVAAVRSFVDFALFVAFFPQLVAGPIVRAVEFLPQMATPPRVSSRQVVEGLHWLHLGLFKKVFLADRLGPQFVDVVFAHPAQYDAFTQRWAVLAYAAQIYCDFSGYSDIAIGCAKWLGFELPQNFNFPYLSASITEFWKRWHISLSTWMRDYLYIPLGGNRRGTLRTYVNLMLTMTLCGLWHGASWNYVMWGFYNGLLLAGHRIYHQALKDRPWAEDLRTRSWFRGSAILVTFLLVAAGYILVRSESWAGCWLMERSWFGGSGEPATRWVPLWVPLLVSMVVVGHLFSGLRGRRCGLLELAPILRAAVYIAAVVLLIAFGPEATRAFIYFQF
ncbi:MAG: MBOAT family protein [Planctomycetes bacterium]|nr:MBOAT family protein [Planctomycetota bacterium]